MHRNILLLATEAILIHQAFTNPTMTNMRIVSRAEWPSSDADVALDALKALTPAPSPSSPAEGIAALARIYNNDTQTMSTYDAAAERIRQGLTTGGVDEILEALAGFFSGENSNSNNNSKPPSVAVYPVAGPNDAPYDVPEDQLRAAIYIPPAFQYGAPDAPQPIILVPATSTTGYESYHGNWIPLLNGASSVGDPVWLNIPGNMHNDAQTNAEYVAYAINYIYSISNQRSVAIVAFSQGNIASHWAYKYWPSARARVTDHIGYSPDYHGSYIANLLAAPGEALSPALIQQQYNATFIAVLRSNGGDSAYVPTTNLYSAYFDEAVYPQFGPNASGALLDARGVGVTNNEVQAICPDQPGSFVYTHEGMLYNPIAWALAQDALSHDGPGQVSRLGSLESMCGLYLAQGLDMSNFLLTEDNVISALVNLIEYPDKVKEEPPIKSEPFNQTE